MTQPSGFPPGGGGGVEIVDKITPPAPGRIIYLTERYEDRYKESDFNITMTVGEIGGNGDKIGFATAPAAAAYDEFGKAGGMLSGSAADAVKGVGLVSVRPNGVLFLVTTEVAFQALIGGSGHSVLEFVPVGTGFFDILVNARSWGPNHPLTLGGFRTLVSNAGEAGFTFRVGEPFVFRVRNGRRHILPNGKIATLGDIKPNGIYEPDFYHASPDGTRWIKGLFSTRAGGVPGAFLLEQGLTNNALQQQRLKGLIVGLERSDTGPDWTLASEARETAVTQASVAVTVGTATLTITLPARFTLGSGGAPGAEGNDWRLIFAQSGTAATIGVVVDRAAKTITTTTNPNGFNFGVARSRIHGTLGITAVFSGSGLNTVVWPGSGSRDFSGGMDAEPIGAEADEDTKTLTVKYDNNDPIKTVRDALHELVVDSQTRLRCKEMNETDLTDTLEAVGMSRGFHGFYATGAV